MLNNMTNIPSNVQNGLFSLIFFQIISVVNLICAENKSSSWDSVTPTLCIFF